MSDLTHVGPDGEARMVDVGGKPESVRVARAAGEIRMAPETLAAIRSDSLAKGDVLAVAKVAGIMAAKRTAELIPLCHPIALTDVDVRITEDEALPGLVVEATARTVGRTGVEMEALTAVSVTLLTIYDMAKSLEKRMSLGRIRLLEKSGGRSGPWRAE
jgi:cyclic pyranopterin phosphate synthase